MVGPRMAHGPTNPLRILRRHPLRARRIRERQMPHDLTRALPLIDVEVKGRTLEGIALRWDTLYRVTDDGQRFYHEGFRRGAFDETMRNRAQFELRREHLDY